MTQAELYAMPLHATAFAEGYEIMRVASGWLYKWETNQYDSLTGNDIIVAVSVTFVPYPEVAAAPEI